jgi:hypothetical protein
MYEVFKTPKTEIFTVYMNFRANTHSERTIVYDLFKDKEWVTVRQSNSTIDGRKLFLQEIRSSKFVLCPRGNGVDTHRLWETLYMGSIPIVKRHVALDEFLDLPICWISEWEEVTKEFLEKEYFRITVKKDWNYDKLKIGYWKNRITNSVNSLSN